MYIKSIPTYLGSRLFCLCRKQPEIVLLQMTFIPPKMPTIGNRRSGVFWNRQMSEPAAPKFGAILEIATTAGVAGTAYATYYLGITRGKERRAAEEERLLDALQQIDFIDTSDQKNKEMGRIDYQQRGRVEIGRFVVYESNLTRNNMRDQAFWQLYPDMCRIEEIVPIPGTDKSSLTVRRWLNRKVEIPVLIIEGTQDALEVVRDTLFKNYKRVS